MVGIAILGGLGAAFCFGTGTLAVAHASRLVGARAVLNWVMIVGFAITAPIALASGRPRDLHARELGWFAVAGVGNVAGLLLLYAALRRGKVAIIAPIASTEGAVAAVLAVIAGEALGVPSALLLATIAVGVVLASLASAEEGGAHTRAATLLAVAAATIFGASLFATAKVSNSLPLVWAVVPPRLVGVLVVALPSLALGRLRIARAAVPFVVYSGICEVVGFACFAVGARHGVAVSAVVTSQASAVAAVAGYVLLKERLRPVQIAGIATVVVAVAALSAIRT